MLMGTLTRPVGEIIVVFRSKYYYAATTSMLACWYSNVLNKGTDTRPLTAKECCTRKVSATINIAAEAAGNPNSRKIITDYSAVVVEWSSSTKTVTSKAAECRRSSCTNRSAASAALSAHTTCTFDASVTKSSSFAAASKTHVTATARKTNRAAEITSCYNFYCFSTVGSGITWYAKSAATHTAAATSSTPDFNNCSSRSRGSPADTVICKIIAGSVGPNPAAFEISLVSVAGKKTCCSGSY
jgi:hypothetical protein